MGKKREINVVVIGPNGYLDARPGLEESGRDTRLGFEKAWRRNAVSFHRNGRRYRVRTAKLARPLASWARFLPSILYNPWVQVAYEFEDLGEYPLEHLVSGVEAAIRQDDDVITQFRDPDELLGRLSRATTFDGVAAVLAYARIGL